MENLILKYLSERMDKQHDEEKEKGSVITISREFGCEGYELAELLINAINKKNNDKKEHPKWIVLHKDILEEAALELNSKPHIISHIFNAEERGFLAELIASFSGSTHVSDETIKNAITKIILGYAEKGHVIIVGRGGCIISRMAPKSLHIRIVAPFEMRVEIVAKRFNISPSQAKEKIEEMDKHRSAFLSLFKCALTDNELFDITFNRKKFTKHEITDTIIKIIEDKNFI
ncbi:MAG: cytidylate kinase-like family protein [Bacteroidales bacterium]|jgi:cytidylate kinase